jgi:hypothetical protein
LILLYIPFLCFYYNFTYKIHFKLNSFIERACREIFFFYIQKTNKQTQAVYRVKRKRGSRPRPATIQIEMRQRFILTKLWNLLIFSRLNLWFLRLFETSDKNIVMFEQGLFRCLKGLDIRANAINFSANRLIFSAIVFSRRDQRENSWWSFPAITLALETGGSLIYEDNRTCVSYYQRFRYE